MNLGKKKEKEHCLLGRVKWKCFVSSQRESMCAGMVHTRSAHLTWRAARVSLCWSTQLWKARSVWVRWLNYGYPTNLASGSRGYLCLTYSNKGSALLALFGQDASTIISLRGWPPTSPKKCCFVERKMGMLTLYCWDWLVRPSHPLEFNQKVGHVVF